MQEITVERDYVLACALAAFADVPQPFVFRGGTALARTYWIDYRLSEDLDLIASAEVPDLESWMQALGERASMLAGIELKLNFYPPRQGWSRSVLVWAGGELIIDATITEHVALAPETRMLDLPYRDLRTTDREVPTVALAEIMGNKWMILDDRNEPRDLYDVWWGLRREGVAFSELARGHHAKYGYQPVRQVLATAEARMKSNWEQRLSHQVRDLPEFDEVLEDVGSAWDDWNRERTGS